MRYNALKYLGLIRGEHRKDYKVALDYFYRASQIDKTDVQVNLGMIVYRVTLVVEYLGWVDLDLGCSTILLGQ